MRIIHKNMIKRYTINLSKGFGLVEALIALVIIALTMISALETVSSSLRQVKDNETENKANELMTSALEFAYGYRNIDLPGGNPTQKAFSDASIAAAGVEVTFCYRSVLDLQSAQISLVQVASGIASCPVITSPDPDPEGSPVYRVTYTDASDPDFIASEAIYHQIIFTNQSVSGTIINDKIRITSVAVYVQEGKIVRQRVDAYRPLNF